MTDDKCLLHLDWLDSRRKAHGQQTELTVATRFGFSLLHDRVFQSSQSLHFDSNGFSLAEPALRFSSRAYS